MKINPNLECKSGKAYRLGFRTGVIKDRKKEAVKRACRDWKKNKGE